MTVSTAYDPLSFAGDDSTDEFAVSWPSFDGTLLVTLIDSDEAETVQTISTHYSFHPAFSSRSKPGSSNWRDRRNPMPSAVDRTANDLPDTTAEDAAPT